MKELYSYDIFDTCLVRTCGAPKNVFEILAITILGKQAESSEIIDFTLVRMRAEIEARRVLVNDVNEEVTLEEIYRFCDFSRLTKTNNTTIMEKEMEIEEKVLLPIEKTKTEINQRLKKGKKVVYISDMYLPKEYLERIMKQLGFYVNHNIFVSSDFRKTKKSGHLFDIVANKLNIQVQHWQHTGDDITSDYKIPHQKGISSKRVKYTYNQYELMGENIMYDGSRSSKNYAFSLSRAIRLTFPETPHTMFASTFIAPMFVSYVYKILCDSHEKGINHLFFIARDGYILYHIALVFANQFPNIKVSYLYASRQALYLAGLNDISPHSIKENMPHLKDSTIDSILYELHIPSYDYSHLTLTGLNGEQIIDLLFTDDLFVEKLTQKYNEQKEYIIRYFIQEELTNNHCGIVDVIGSRRCQRALNNILRRNNYPQPFSYFFEVTWCRINEYEPYLAMNYQEKVINTPFYNRVSQPLYEQFFAITNQRRTIEYQEYEGIIKPVFESDFISESYKQHIFSINKSICTEYAKHYWINRNEDPLTIIQTTQKVFSSFCFVPRKEFLLAIESFKCTGSGIPNETLLNKKNLVYVISHITEFFRWPEGQLIYSSGWLYPLILLFLRKRYNRLLNKKC